MAVTNDEILALNLNGSKAIDFQKEALSKIKSIPMDAGASKHDILQRRLQLKTTKKFPLLKNSDDLYNSIIQLKKTGLLKNMLEKAGVTTKYLKEDSPIVPMNSGNPLTLVDTYSKTGIKKYKVNKKELGV